MRKLIVKLIFWVLFWGVLSYTSNAQIRALLRYGVRAGLSSSTLLNSDHNIDGRRTGVVAGLYGIAFIPHVPFSIQPELLYVQKGAEINGTEINLSYIEIPLLAKLNFIKTNTTETFLLFGPYLGFNIKNEDDPKGSLSPSIGDAKSSDFGLIFGAELGLKKINLGLRYSLGLTHVFENDDARNSGISLVAGFNL